eukprot:TRINITY_DN1722_c0_g1_i1.p1 TRINITY_DN1722_c0_g1~~TRINITY_DN1722_c0_g1_i1.p1  ORF type:complete len:333 (-),score=23.90 TRINITY_DN1722_c0_g1_i1:139-1137(-)
MRWSDAVVKACLSMGCVIGLMLLAISFDVGSIQQLYFSETVIRVELPHHTAPSLPWSLDEGDEDSLVVQNNTSMRKCFKNVPRHNGRCGYYANIVESMKSGTTALWNLMQQHQRLGGRTVHCSFKDYNGCLVQANASPAVANIDKGPIGTRCQALIDDMYESAPYQKLIFLFRHPVDRIYSHYQHQVRSAVRHYNGSFEKWLRRELKQDCFDPQTGSWKNCFYNETICAMGKNAMSISAYADILELYWTRYPRNESYILITEELYSDTQRHMDGLMDWLGLDRITYMPPRNSNIQSYKPLEPKLRSKLYETYYKVNVERLEAILGRKLPWKA